MIEDTWERPLGRLDETNAHSRFPQAVLVDSVSGLTNNPITNAHRIGGFLTKKLIHVSLLILICAALFPNEAWAYLDPGTGSLIVQSLIAALAAAGFALRLYWGRLRSWFQRSDAAEPPADER